MTNHHTMTTPQSIEEIVATYSDRAAKMFLSSTIPGAQWWLERMAEALTTYGNARYEEGVKAERERVGKWAQTGKGLYPYTCNKCNRKSFVVELSKKCPFCDTTNKTVEEEIESLVDNMNAYVDCVDWAPYGDEEFKQKILDLLTSQRQTLRKEIGKLSKEQDGKATMTFSDGSTADIKLHSDMALGYNQALADVLSLIDNN